MKNYYRIMLGKKSKYAEEAFKEGFIGAGFVFDVDLAAHLPENWKDFNREFIPIYLERHPDKSKIAAGLSCGFLHTVAKGIKIGDIVLCPDGKGNYHIGEITSDYHFQKDQTLPHRRKVNWYNDPIERGQMSQELQRSAGSIGTVSNISKYADEIEALMSGKAPGKIICTDATIEDPSVFALEKHLEDFLVKNWSQTELGRRYNIFEDEDGLTGQQLQTDTGPLDILAESKDKKELLVVELKKGRSSDSVVGQIQRYMGYVKDELAEPDQIVKGIIIAFEEDPRIKRALSVAQNIEFYTYKIDFKLLPIRL